MKLASPLTRIFNTYVANSQSERLKKKMISINFVKQFHANLISTGLYKYPFSISIVIRSYAVSSPPYLDKSHLAFNQIDKPTLFIWNHMIRGLSKGDEPTQAIYMYSRMYHQGLVGDNLTFIFVLKACARGSDILHGQNVHVHATKLGFESYLFVSNALIHMYASCGYLVFAQKVFDKMVDRDLVSWNSLLCGFSQHNRFNKVLFLFDEMVESNVKPDSVTMMKVIFACSYLGEYERADSVVKYMENNHVGIDVYLGNTMIDMYGRRGLVDLAWGAFKRIKERNTVSWNAMIKAFAKVGNFVRARELFDEMPSRDVISWTSMITGYCQAKIYTEAVRLFEEMIEARAKPDEITVASVLSACAHMGSLDVGEAVHDYICSQGIKVDIYVGNALIDMYCKCGVVKKALMVFQKMKQKDSVSWTSVISGLAVNGIADPSLELFSQMLGEGIRPTHGVFVGVLLACAHVGFVEKGLEYFDSMEKVYGLVPEMKHYGCVVDLLSRFGNLHKAYEFIEKMPVVPDVVVWRILLSACKLHGNVALAEIVCRKLFELDPCNSGNYVLSSNTYAGLHRWDDVIKMRNLMERSNVQKPFGSSSIEVDDTRVLEK